MISIKKVLSKLIKSNENSNYILIGDVGICWGNAGSKTVTGNSIDYLGQITFPFKFLNTPNVFMGSKGTYPSSLCYNANPVSTANFDIRGHNTSSSTLSSEALWLAIGFIDRTVVGGGA